MTTPAIDRARDFSNRRLAELRSLMPGVVPPGTIVVACGSYARREASMASDFDYFAIAPSDRPADDASAWVTPLRDTIERVVKVAPAPDGAFGKVETRESIARDIGGQGDDNQKLTRRMLFLLEGVPLNDEAGFAEVRRSVLDRYLRASPSDEPLVLFLLHDVIRYYRTMAVDYEYKTTEGERPKPWGLRNVKLMFSRKLLYASGLFSVAATRDPTPGGRAKHLGLLFDLPVLDRIGEICGHARAAPVWRSYDRFLALLENGDVRRRLEGLTLADRTDPVFADIKAEGQGFAGALLRLFHETFAADHPIHRAMVF